MERSKKLVVVLVGLLVLGVLTLNWRMNRVEDRMIMNSQEIANIEFALVNYFQPKGSTVNLVKHFMPMIVMIEIDDDVNDLLGNQIHVIRKTSGICIGPDLILTCAHALNCSNPDINDVIICFRDGHKFPVKAYAISKLYDVAVILFDPGDYNHPWITNLCDEVIVGSTVVTFGHPYYTEFSVSRGIISNVMDNLGRVQIDAQVNPGNSGGPVIDEIGRVIGIVSTAVASPGNGVGMVVSSMIVNQCIDDLIDEVRE